jgi:anti-anti-sigma factor
MSSARINPLSDLPLPAPRAFKRMKITPENQSLLLQIGEMEIWDGADLALLREGLTQLIETERVRSICIDMHYVKYIPSGFFGMLFDWLEKRGVQFYLTAPQPNVQRMLWFRQFFYLTTYGWYEMRPSVSDEAVAYLEPQTAAGIFDD